MWGPKRPGRRNSTAQNHPWIVGFSGGKDSTLVAQAAFAAMMDIAPSRLTREVHVVANDTLVESPLVVTHLHQSLREMREGARIHGFPVTVATTAPDSAQTFWVLLIGKGYPSPNQRMRWCTDRLKIEPTRRYIREQVAELSAPVQALLRHGRCAMRREFPLSRLDRMWRNLAANRHRQPAEAGGKL